MLFTNKHLLNLNYSNIDVNQKSSFLRKYSARYSLVFVVTELVESRTQCEMFSYDTSKRELVYGP